MSAFVDYLLILIRENSQNRAMNFRDVPDLVASHLFKMASCPAETAMPE